MDIDSLVDYYPLPHYHLCGVSVVALHHYLFVSDFAGGCTVAQWLALLPHS